MICWGERAVSVFGITIAARKKGATRVTYFALILLSIGDSTVCMSRCLYFTAALLFRLDQSVLCGLRQTTDVFVLEK